ncbi:MAG: hypothetical protein V3S23_02730 [Kiloniellales bacterium]
MWDSSVIGRAGLKARRGYSTAKEARQEAARRHPTRHDLDILGRSMAERRGIAFPG